MRAGLVFVARSLMGMLAVGALAAGAAAMQGAAHHAVIVPRGDGTPVITDGLFTAGEWDDSLELIAADGLTLYLKEHHGVVFVGVRSRGRNEIGPSELSLAGSDGRIRRLHVSAALAEVIVPPDGPVPPLQLGFTVDWYANEQRRDEAQVSRLKQEGKDPVSVMRESSYPMDGIEFAIRRSKIPGASWRLRLWVSALVGGRPGMVTYPPDAADRITERWLELRLP